MLNCLISEYFMSFKGIRQRENHSPLLFSLYINDLEDYRISQDCQYLDFNDEMLNQYMKILMLMYADDTIIVADSKEGLQKALNCLEDYCSKWKLKVNSAKQLKLPSLEIENVMCRI